MVGFVKKKTCDFERWLLKSRSHFWADLREIGHGKLEINIISGALEYTREDAIRGAIAFTLP